MRKLLLLGSLFSFFSLLFGSSLFADWTPAPLPVPNPSQTAVTLIQPTLLRFNYGESALDFRLTQHHSANSLQVKYARTAMCPVAPDVALQVQYAGNNVWYSTSVDQGNVFRHSGFNLTAIRLLFRQLRYTYVDCEMSVVGLENN
jgi:hypothetical protein